MLLLMFGILFISLASSALIGPFSQSQNVELIQICDDCTYNNITTIIFPNGTHMLLNVEMDQNGTYFNWTLDSQYTQNIGIYIVNGVGDLEGSDTVWAYDFDITPTGNEINTGSSLIYGVLLFMLLLFNFFYFFIIFQLSIQNPRNEDTGQIMGISLKKYIKIVMIGTSYGIILLTLNLMVALSEAIQLISQFSGIIGSIFSIMLSLAWIWTVCIIIWILFNVINDFKIVKDLKNKMEEAEQAI